jgi:hypothetical protein
MMSARDETNQSQASTRSKGVPGQAVPTAAGALSVQHGQLSLARRDALHALAQKLS